MIFPFLFLVYLRAKKCAMEKRWIFKDTPDVQEVQRLSEELNIEQPLAALLLQRGFSKLEEIDDFFDPKIEKLHDPFLMLDMDKAVQRLSQAIENNEKIMVYGDYDVDGTSAVALMYSFLRELIGSDHKKFIEYYIPDRYSEGYGISEKGIQYCIDNNFTLLISLDCGIKANEIIDYAQSNGVDVIICDHHLQGDELPNAVAILDPKRDACTYPYKELTGCGVGFKLIQAYCNHFELPDQLWLSLLDLVAISIASDIVSITGENRILAYYGLIIINRFPRMGVKSIIEQANIRIQYPPKKNTIFSRQITISDLVFFIGPKINAAGRMKSGKESVRLLVCDDEDKSKEIGENIEEQNKERKELDKKATEEAVNQFVSLESNKDKKCIVVYNPDWVKGIIGIVASRLVEEFYRPVVVFTDSTDGLLTGSARSIKEFNIYDGIDHCSHLLEHFGGHKYAAGLSLKKENLEAFKEQFEQFVVDHIQEDPLVPEIEIDLKLDLSEITQSFVDNLMRFAPFGPGNMSPLFLSSHVSEAGNPKIVGERHLKMTVFQRETKHVPLDVIAFNQKEYFEPILKNNDFNIIYHVEKNTWNNVTNTQLNVKDIKINE